MPSKQHNDLTRRALIWLGNIATGKGIRGVPEITLSEGYVADGGAILNFQYRFLKKLVTDEQSKITDDYSVIIESKASRSDFQKTFVRNGHFADRMIPRANFHFVVTSKGIVSTDEVPDFWGHLEESRNGLKLKRLPKYCQQSTQSLHEFAYCILRYSNPNKFYMMNLQNITEEMIEQDDLQLVFPELLNNV